MTRELTSVDSELPGVHVLEVEEPPPVTSNSCTTTRLKVHVMADIRDELRRRQSQMREIDAKKTRVDRHIAVTAATATDKKADLKARLEALNGHMTTTKTRLLARISECSSMSADAEQFNRKYSEVKDMLQALKVTNNERLYL